jgi:hypothetical protein
MCMNAYTPSCRSTAVPLMLCPNLTDEGLATGEPILNQPQALSNTQIDDTAPEAADPPATTTPTTTAAPADNGWTTAESNQQKKKKKKKKKKNR